MTTKAPPPSIRVTNTRIVQTPRAPATNPQPTDPLAPHIAVTIEPRFQFDPHQTQVLQGGTITVEIAFFGTVNTLTAKATAELDGAHTTALNNGNACTIDIPTTSIPLPPSDAMPGNWLLSVSGAIPVHHDSDGGGVLDVIPILSVMTIPKGLLASLTGLEG